MSGNLVATARGGSNGDDVGISRRDFGGEGAKLNTKIIDTKGKLIEGIVDVLKTGFDGIAGGVVLARSVLTNSVGELVIGRSFFTRGDVEVTPVDDIGGGFEMLSESGGEREEGKREEKEKIFNFHRFLSQLIWQD